MSKNASVNVRIDEDVKQGAEDVLEKLGISRSNAIDLYYRQIILNDGIPFELNIPSQDELTKKEFNQILAKGLKEANNNQSDDLDTVFNELKQGL